MLHFKFGWFENECKQHCIHIAMANLLEPNLYEANLFDPPAYEQLHNEELVDRLLNRLTDLSSTETQDRSDILVFDFLTQLEDAAKPTYHECYICGNTEASEVQGLKCGHALCLDCIQSQVDHLPKPGEQFSTRNAKCGICSSWIDCKNVPKEFLAIKAREDALLERLNADNDPDPELHELIASGALLSKWQFMICLYVH
jgi:hypothetical protein